MGKNAFKKSVNFIRIDWDLYLTEAFQGMTTTQQAVLVDFIGRYRSVASNWVSFSWKQRQNRSIGHTAFKEAVLELVNRGFIEKSHENGHKALYAESAAWRQSPRVKRPDTKQKTGSESDPDRAGIRPGTEPESDPVPSRNPTRTEPESDPHRAGIRPGLTLRSDREDILDRPVGGGNSASSESPPGGDPDLARGDSRARPLDSPGLDPGNNGTERPLSPKSTLRVAGSQESTSSGFANNGTERDGAGEADVRDEKGELWNPHGQDPGNRVPKNRPPLGSSVRELSGIKCVGDVAAAMVGRIRRA